jgi:hypothetical protein
LYPVALAVWLNFVGKADRLERLDINTLVTGREINGEIFSDLCFELYPQKINTEIRKKLLIDSFK